MLNVYRDPTLLWTLTCIAVALVLLWLQSQHPWTRIAAIALIAAPFVFTLASLYLYDDADERGDSLLALWPLLLVLAAALAICESLPSANGTNPARVPAPDSARRHPRHLDVAAALGIDVRHLAVAYTAAGGAARLC